MSARERSFRSARMLGMGLIFLLGLNVVVAAVMVAFRLFEIGLLQRIGRGESVFGEAVRSDQRVKIGVIVGLALVLVTGIVWLVWQHRSHANLHAARLRELEYTPAWAVGWWMVPFANLGKPFQVVRELWKASGGDERWRHVETWPLIGWWWAGWIGGLAFERVAGAVTGDAPTLDTLITGSSLFLATEVITILTGILAIAIVRAVNQRQAGLVQIIADRTAVPTRPDVLHGDERQNP